MRNVMLLPDHEASQHHASVARPPSAMGHSLALTDSPVLIMDGGGFKIFVVELTPRGTDRFEVITKYEGRTTGILYTRREVDCRTFRARYFKEAETLAEVRTTRDGGPTDWYELAQGAGQWRMARFACYREVRPN